MFCYWISFCIWYLVSFVSFVVGFPLFLCVLGISWRGVYTNQMVLGRILPKKEGFRPWRRTLDNFCGKHLEGRALDPSGGKALGLGEEREDVPALVGSGGVDGIDGTGSDSAGRVIPQHALDHPGASVGHGHVEVDDGGGVVFQEEVGHMSLTCLAGSSEGVHTVVPLVVEGDEVIETAFGGDLGDVTTPDRSVVCGSGAANRDVVVGWDGVESFAVHTDLVGSAFAAEGVVGVEEGHCGWGWVGGKDELCVAVCCCAGRLVFGTANV